MPEEDGFSLMRSLRSTGAVVPAIALTAFARREDADEAYAAGFQMHLSKPIDAGRLIDAIATLLEHGSIQ
jgi:CheY-like chemotaxis protein